VASTEDETFGIEFMSFFYVFAVILCICYLTGSGLIEFFWIEAIAVCWYLIIFYLCTYSNNQNMGENKSTRIKLHSQRYLEQMDNN